MTKHCIITGDPITRQNDSKAHIIPSALAGRLKPLGVICADANNLLGDKIDLPLIQAFQSLMNLLGGSRDRGDNQPTRMTDESGKTYVFEFGEPLALTKPEFQELEVDGQTRIQIKARNLREARTVLGRVKAKHPSFDVDEALKLAVTEHRWPDGMLNHKMQIGPSVVFPAVFVAASIFASFHGQTPHPQLRTYVSSFDPKTPTLPADTFYFIPAIRWIDVPADVAHCLAFIGDAATRKALVYVELFNIVCVGVVLPFNGTVDVTKTYSINVLTGEEIPMQIDEKVAKSTPWTATHQLGDSALCAFTTEKMNSLISVALKRQWDNNIQQIVRRALGEANGRRLLPRDCASLIKEVVDFIKVLWMHPAYTREVREAQLPLFDTLCKTVEKMLPFFARCEFRNLIRPYHETLTNAAVAN